MVKIIKSRKDQNLIMNQELEAVYEKYYNEVNMSYSELKTWANNPCSKKASLDRSPIKRNLHLLSTPKSRWKTKEISWANKTISYLARARKIKSSNEICNGYTKNEIALKNWAYDVNR